MNRSHWITNFGMAFFMGVIPGIVMAQEDTHPPPNQQTPPVEQTVAPPRAPEPVRRSVMRDLWKGVARDLGFKAGDAPAEAPPPPGSAPVIGKGIEQYLPPVMRQIVEKYNVRIAMIGNFIYEGLDAAHDTKQDAKHLFLDELELTLTADISSTVRLDLIYALARDGTDWSGNFEEAYLTFLDLPLDFQLRLGKFKAAFGKANQLHAHALPWIDLPAAETNFFGDQLSGTGFSLSRLIPNPWNVYSEFIVQVFDVDYGREPLSFGGREPAPLGGQEARGWTELVHWKNVLDLTPESTLEVGLSGASIPQKKDGRSIAEGLDVTYKWRPQEQGLYHSIVWMNELYAMQNDTGSGQSGDLVGAYSSFEYQFARRWSAGMRLDVSEVANQSGTEFGVVPFITFRQTERLYYRLQFNHIENDPDHGGQSSNDLRLQFNFSLGSHSPHIY